MSVAGFVVGLLGFLLALVGLAGEIAKRPRLDVEPATWAGSGDFPWEFLVVRVFNRPLPRWASWLFTRRSAAGCQISVSFFAEGDSSASIDQIPGRWSAAHEPTSWQASGASPDPSKVPNSYRLDVVTTAPGEEVAVARSREGEAYAFSAESYLHPAWRRPGWELSPGRWRVVMRVAAADAQAMKCLSFQVSDSGALGWL